MTTPAGEDTHVRADPRRWRDLVALALVAVAFGCVLVGSATWNWHAGMIVFGVEVLAVAVFLGVEP